MLKCYAVGDYDYVAANDDEAEAVRLMNEMCGEGSYEPDEVCEVVGSLLDTPWQDEDTKEPVGTLRGWLAEATEPKYLCGTEG